jgi:short-subunit dehydrogenase
MPQHSPAADPHGTNRTTRPLAVVTGGSEGIGLAIARLLAQRGHDLLLIARRPERLAEAADSIGSASSANVATLALDLTWDDACDRIDAELVRLNTHIDLLVNAAGMGLSGPFVEADTHRLDQLGILNMAAPARLMRCALPGMRARRRGGIINVASMGGLVPGPYQAAYYASKAYLISLSEAVAAEVRQDGVRITVVAPGPVDTEFHAKMYAESAFYWRFLPSSSPESVAQWAVRGHELGLRLVIPGVLNALAAVALKLMPHALLVPVMAWLLDPRRQK